MIAFSSHFLNEVETEDARKSARNVSCCVGLRTIPSLRSLEENFNAIGSPNNATNQGTQPGTKPLQQKIYQVVDIVVPFRCYCEIQLRENVIFTIFLSRHPRKDATPQEN